MAAYIQDISNRLDTFSYKFDVWLSDVADIIL
jgi:hypothetical protein